MKSRTIFLIVFVLLGGLMLSSCRGSIGTASWPGVSSSGDTLYLSYATGVYSIRITDGNLTWRFPSETKNTIQFYAPILPADSQLIVGDYSNTLYSIDPQNGNQKWVFDDVKGRFIASANTSGDFILAPCTDNNLYAINQKGLLQWTFSESKQPLWAQPVTNGDLVYQGSMDHSLYAVNVSNGNLAWKLDLDGAVVYAPLLADGILYIPTLADTVYAVDTSTQKVLWQFKTDEEVWGIPVMQDGILYFADLSGQIYALDAQSGQVSWRIDAGGSVAGSAGVTSEGLVFLTETGDVLMVNFEGVKQWTRSIDGQLYGTPAIGEDRIVVPVVGGEELLVTFDFNGNQVWTFVPPK